MKTAEDRKRAWEEMDNRHARERDRAYIISMAIMIGFILLLCIGGLSVPVK